MRLLSTLPSTVIIFPADRYMFLLFIMFFFNSASTATLVKPFGMWG
jgi:hypothetical protein